MYEAIVLSLWFLPLMPLFGAAVLFGVARLTARINEHDRSSVLGVLAVATLLLTLAVAVWATTNATRVAWSWWGPVLRPSVTVTDLARIMIVLVPVIAIPVVLYTASSMQGDAGLPRLLALLVAFCGAMELLVIAADLLTLLIGWELVGATSWALIGYEWRDATHPRAALDAFITTRVGDLGLYLAAAALFGATGSLDFVAMVDLHGTALTVVVAGILLAAAAKSAQLPFSPWLFSAMAGPTPASALLHSATMVAAGAYLLAHLSPFLSAATWFGPVTVTLGLATALAGGIVALLQPDLKRALAASTSAQYGLMLVAIGAGVPAAAAAHLVAHAAFKALLFLGAGVVFHAAGTLDLDRLRLGSALPRVARLFGVGTLALAAVPPLGGAFSKEQVLAAAGHGPGSGTLLVVGVLIAGFLSAMYAGRLQLLVFGNGDAPPTREPVQGPSHSPSRTEISSVAVLAVISIVLGLLWLPSGSRLLERTSGSTLAPGSWWFFIASIATIIIAAIADWTLWRRGALYAFGLRDVTRAQVADWLGIPALARVVIVRPVLQLADFLATFDKHVVDAGVRGAVRITTIISHVFAWWAERGLDWIISTIAHSTQWAAGASSGIDDHGIDAGVERIAQGVGALGEDSRQLQTGLTHQYYTILAVGIVVILVVVSLSRFMRGFAFGQ